MAFIGYPEKRDRLFKALDFCTKVERKAVITTDKDGATAEEFAEYVVETLHKDGGARITQKSQVTKRGELS